MAYVDLSHDAAAMRRIFLGLGLAAPDEEVKAVALTGGVSSGIYEVQVRSGRYCVKQALAQLKVAKEWKVPVERVFAEIDWLRTVGAIVPGQVPRVLGMDEASKSFVMEFLGSGHRNWKADLLAGHVDVNVARGVGDMLGRVHHATADDAQLAARFATDSTFHAIRLDPYLAETARAHPAVADRLLGLLERTAATRRALVHGDVSPKNILIGSGGPVLLDAECAWFGDPAFDVAFCLNHLLLKAVHIPQRLLALMDSFATLREAYLARVTWEAPEAVEARIASLLPALALARVDGKSPVEYLDEPQRDVVRNLALKLLHGVPTSLHVIAAFWAWELGS